MRERLRVYGLMTHSPLPVDGVGSPLSGDAPEAGRFGLVGGFSGAAFDRNEGIVLLRRRLVSLFLWSAWGEKRTSKAATSELHTPSEKKVEMRTGVGNQRPWSMGDLISCPISTSKGLGKACQIAPPVSQPPSLSGWDVSAGPACAVRS